MEKNIIDLLQALDIGTEKHSGDEIVISDKFRYLGLLRSIFKDDTSFEKIDKKSTIKIRDVGPGDGEGAAFIIDFFHQNQQKLKLILTGRTAMLDDLTADNRKKIQTLGINLSTETIDLRKNENYQPERADLTILSHLHYYIPKENFMSAILKYLNSSKYVCIIPAGQDDTMDYNAVLVLYMDDGDLKHFRINADYNLDSTDLEE